MNNKVKSKDYVDKKREITDIASEIFLKKGFDKSSVEDILNEVGIAKGTFYYYFKSKEEVLDAVIEKAVALIVQRIRPIMKIDNISSREKLFKAILSMKIDKDVDSGILEEIHLPNNALLHQKMLELTVNNVEPFLTEIIVEGIEKGEFTCEYPKEYMKILLTSATILLDFGIFKMSDDEKNKILVALFSILEKALGLNKGAFLELSFKYIKN